MYDEVRRPLISLVVPVFNADKYLDFMLSGFEKQSIESVEYIFVDDGSTDDSWLILSAFKEKHPATTLVKQENKGAYAARNAGMAIANGKYISFPDADDLVDPEMFSKLCSFCEENELDVATANSLILDEDGSQQVMYPSVDFTLGSGSEWYEKCLERRSGGFWHCICPSVYRLSWLKENGFAFHEGFNGFDVPWTASILMRAEQFGFYDENLYFYYRRQGSLSLAKSNKQKVRTVDSLLVSTNMLLNLRADVAEKFSDSRFFDLLLIKRRQKLFHSLRDVDNEDDKKECARKIIESKFFDKIYPLCLSGKEKIKHIFVYAFVLILSR
ncbi:glycosyltransferase [Vogesella indigofera]|uniref:glycosyltransferase n=1 Tax=Vogesella indigofera TaxID=45465 RepID=UPI00234F0EC0|nr:glycosyltransferase [Vogesella indigofera]MDC7711139.1 glycosyltransferase [Vogesella indigofera]